MPGPAIALFLAVPALVAGADVAPAEPRASLDGKLNSVVESFVDAGAFQGVVLLAVDGQVIYEGAFGKASHALEVDNTPETVFQIASVSKPFTASAIQLLAQRGSIDLHAPLSRVLPDYPNGDRLTIDHLLTHTSGIPNINGFPEYDDWSKHNHRPADLVERFRDRPLMFEPGDRYSYSNSNYNLLARIIEKVSGETYGEFLKRNIFDPLGMEHTGHRQETSTIVPGLAPGHAPEGARGVAAAPYLDWSIKTGNGSLYSTARDLLRFHSALQRGAFLTPASLEAAYGFERGLGYGWYPGERFGERTVRITGRSPGYTAHFERFVESDRCFVVLSNLYISPPRQLTDALAAILTGREPPSSEFGLGFETTPAKLARFAGRYTFGEDWFVGRVVARVEARPDHLRVVYTDGDRAGYTFLLVPIGPGRFFDRNHGGVVRFERDSETSPWTLVYVFGREWRASPHP